MTRPVAARAPSRRNRLKHLLMIAGAAASLLGTAPAHGCMTDAALNLEDVRYADVVLVGRISNYRIIRDMEFRRNKLASPKLSAEERAFYSGAGGLMSDYARFVVNVDQVLRGKVPPSIVVTWDNSTFGEPDKMMPGPYLLALRRSSSRVPPLRGPSATVSPSREPSRLTVLQAPCSGAFIFGSESGEARVVRQMLKGRTERASSKSR